MPQSPCHPRPGSTNALVQLGGNPYPVCSIVWPIKTTIFPRAKLARYVRCAALDDFFVEEFLDLNARDHRDGIPGALLGTNGTASANVPVDNDYLMRAIAGVIGVVDLIDTIDRTKVHAPFAPGAPINVNPGFRPRSTRPLRSLRHDSPATFLAHIWKHMCSYHAVVQCSPCSPKRLMFAVHSKALAACLQVRLSGGALLHALRQWCV